MTVVLSVISVSYHPLFLVTAFIAFNKDHNSQKKNKKKIKSSVSFWCDRDRDRDRDRDGWHSGFGCREESVVPHYRAGFPEL